MSDFEDAAILQFQLGAANNGATDPELPFQIPDRRQNVAWPQFPEEQSRLDTLLDLGVNRDGGISLDYKFQ
jgi:hypothetical protein